MARERTGHINQTGTDRAEGEEVRRGRKIRRWLAWFAAGLVVTVLCFGAAVWIGASAVLEYVMTIF